MPIKPIVAKIWSGVKGRERERERRASIAVALVRECDRSVKSEREKH